MGDQQTTYQMNTKDLATVSNMFQSVQYLPRYKILEELPASGVGQLMLLTVESSILRQLSQHQRSQIEDLCMELIEQEH